MSVTSINFDDGVKKIKVNDNGYIKWSPTDVNFVDRYLIFADWVEAKHAPEVEELIGKMDNIKDYKVGSASKLGKDFNAELDKVFGEGTSKVVFGDMNPISPVSNGKFLFQNFLEALDPVIQESFNQFEENSDKYLNKAEEMKKNIGK